MATEPTYTREQLSGFEPRHATFVGIDSDGCVFDTMEIKQKQCFHGLIVSHWSLEPIEKYVRETAEFVNLYSTSRGTNRFLALRKVFDLLRERPEVRAAGVPIPPLRAMDEFIASGAALGNPALEQRVRETGNKELASLLEWSQAVNALIARTVKNIPPFKWVRESLERVRENSDAICVSQTPSEALVREWQEHDLVGYVSVIAGQELGTKTEHIRLASSGRYGSDRVLMIGDAPGDRKAADANGALFFPINPAKEEVSWERFYTEAYDRFLAGEYTGAYQQRVIAEFEALLPEQPPWQIS